MRTETLTLSESFREFARGLRQLHRLTIAGQSDSPEADALRDCMDGPWESLSNAERAHAQGLSSDLYSISDPPSGQEPGSFAGIERYLEAVANYQLGDWDRVLELLRQCGAIAPQAAVSHLRGSAWLRAGDPATASLFFEHALQLEPDNDEYRVSYLNVRTEEPTVEANGEVR